MYAVWFERNNKSAWCIKTNNRQGKSIYHFGLLLWLVNDSTNILAKFFSDVCSSKFAIQIKEWLQSLSFICEPGFYEIGFLLCLLNINYVVADGAYLWV